MSKNAEYAVEQTKEHYLATLTDIIDNINDEPRITHELLHTKLWSYLDQLRNDPQRETLIKDWKYKSDFLSAEKCHRQDEKTYPPSKWQQSYTMFLYLCIYH
jgi:hypothetical protein